MVDGHLNVSAESEESDTTIGSCLETEKITLTKMQLLLKTVGRCSVHACVA